MTLPLESGSAGPQAVRRKSVVEFIASHGIVVAICLVFVVIQAYSAWAVSPVADEPAHLVAGLHIWRTGKFDIYCVNPPLVKQIAAFPAFLLGHHGRADLFDASDTSYRSEFSRGRQFFAQDPEQAIRLITYGRWACLPFGLIGLLVSLRWATELYGTLAGYLAGLLWIASPTVLGHMPLITADGAATSLGLLASYAFWHFLRESNWLNTWFVGIALGVCLLTKTFWILLFFLWPAMLLFWLIVNARAESSSRDNSSRRPPWLKVWIQLAAALGLGLTTLNLGYAFSGVGRPLRDFEFRSATLSGKLLEMMTSGNRFQNSWLGRIPVPMPADYVRGIDLQRKDFEIYPSSYLLGMRSQNGRWYYYLYALGVKEASGVLLLMATALGATVCLSGCRRHLRDEIILLAPAIAVFILVSSQTRMNHHFRYVLPSLPFFYIFAGKLAGEIPGKVIVRWVLISLTWALISTLTFFPYTIAYFNELAGGPSNGWRHLDDSCTDWGQGMFALKQWQDRHPERQPILLARWSHGIDPRQFAVEYLPMPPDNRGPNMGDSATRIEPVAGWYLISTNEIQYETYRYLRDERPRECIAGCYLVYYITQERAVLLRGQLPSESGSGRP